MAQRATVLVVDDSEPIRSLLTLALEGHFAVRTVSGGPSALDALARGGVDAVLLDVDMPGMSGWDVLARMREADRLRQVPVFMMSAAWLDGAPQAAREGAQGFIRKPMKLAAVRSAITAALR